MLSPSLREAGPGGPGGPSGPGGPGAGTKDHGSEIVFFVFESISVSVFVFVRDIKISYV